MASKELEKPRITLEEFNQAVRKNSETVYNELSEEFKEVFQQWNRLRAERNEQRTSKDQLLAEKQQLERQIESLKEERDDYQAEWRVAQRRVEELRQGSQAPGETPVSNASNGGGKSEKIPDPPLFSDGTKPQFPDWLSAMRTKLRANADRYPTEELKMAYIQSRVTGEAADHLRPLLDEEDPMLQAMTAHELFEKLKSIYLDPNRYEQAADDFSRLWMKDINEFQAFHTRFLRLALDSKVPTDRYKFEMNRRLHSRLRELVIAEYNSSNSFTSFVNVCSTTAHQLKVIQSSNNRRKQRQNNGSASSPDKSSGSGQPREAAPKSDEIRACFKCQKVGHLARWYPNSSSTSGGKCEGRGSPGEKVAAGTMN